MLGPNIDEEGVWGGTGAIFGPFWGPQMGPKWSLKWIHFWTYFLIAKKSPILVKKGVKKYENMSKNEEHEGEEGQK